MSKIINSKEIWDVYDACGNKLEGELIRGEDIPQGMYHLVSEVLVCHDDGTYLVMKRDCSKQNYPGKYESTAGGSALKGEHSLDAAKRELLEETGLIAIEWREIGVDSKHNTIYVYYVCAVNCDKNSVKLQVGETIDYKWLKKNEFRLFLQSDECIPSQSIRLLSYLFNTDES